MAGRKPEPLLEYGPFFGMRYAYDPLDNGEDRNVVYEALNMVPADPIRGGGYLRRWGDDRATVAASNLQGQWLGVFRRAGSLTNVGIFAGEIYKRDVVSWTKEISTANLTAAGITVSATAPCGCVTFNDVLVINDGVNQPFTWDGTSGGGLTLLSNAPATCLGVPVVYYGKLFFIKAAARSTIVWSEENAPNTGYEAGGYSNLWRLEQSGHGPIYALAARNEGLYFFRSPGIGVIRGAVSANFSGDGVLDGISLDEGTSSLFGVTVTEDAIYFPLTYTRELCAIVSGRVHRLGNDLQDVLQTTRWATGAAATSLPGCRTVAVPAYGAIAVAYNTTGQGLTGPLVYLYSTATRRCIARLSFQYDVAVDADSPASPVIGDAVGGSSGIGLTVAAQNGGSTYTFQTPTAGSSTTWYDTTTPPALYQLTLGPMSAPPDEQFAVDQLEAFFDVAPKSGSGATTITIADRETNTKLVGGSTADLGSVSLSTDATHRQELRKVLGVNQHWRTFQLTIRDSGTLRDYPWGVKRVHVYGQTEPLEPETS